MKKWKNIAGCSLSYYGHTVKTSWKNINFIKSYRKFSFRGRLKALKNARTVKVKIFQILQIRTLPSSTTQLSCFNSSNNQKTYILSGVQSGLSRRRPVVKKSDKNWTEIPQYGRPPEKITKSLLNTVKTFVYVSIIFILNLKIDQCYEFNIRTNGRYWKIELICEILIKPPVWLVYFTEQNVNLAKVTCLRVPASRYRGSWDSFKNNVCI